jgi:hypothetical protein
MVMNLLENLGQIPEPGLDIARPQAYFPHVAG